MRYIIRSAVNVLRRSSASLRAPVVAASAVCAATMCPAYAQVTETVLYSFLGGSDGGIVYAPVIADLSGNGAPRALYGTTGYAGILADCGGQGCGTVFKLTPTEYGQTPWSETVLHSFSGGATVTFLLPDFSPAKTRFTKRQAYTERRRA